MLNTILKVIKTTLNYLNLLMNILIYLKLLFIKKTLM